MVLGATEPPNTESSVRAMQLFFLQVKRVLGVCPGSRQKAQRHRLLLNLYFSSSLSVPSACAHCSGLVKLHVGVCAAQFQTGCSKKVQTLAKTHNKLCFKVLAQLEEQQSVFACQ